MKKTKHRPSPRQNRVFQLVHRGSRIQHQIAQLSEQLKPIEEMLRVEALKRPFEHLSREDGKADQVEWSARAAGAECRIIFPSPQLQEVFGEDHPELVTIRRLCGGRFSQLFTESLQVRITDPSAFRQKVAHLFTPDQATLLLRLCSILPESVVVWTCATPRKDKQTGRRVLP